MDAKQAALMQMRIRNNAGDLQDYLKGLDSWEEQIKKKDASLSRQKPILKETVPPVRGSQTVKKAKKKRKERTPVKSVTQNQPRINSYDFKSWDKFDVEKACEEVDYQVEDVSTEEEEEDDNQEIQRRQQAVVEKEKGNELFKQGRYDMAVESYSVASELDPLNAVMPANRAMALLKLERYAAAESDCSMALALDDCYLKAYLRRGTARLRLGKTEEARKDFDAVLRLEPGHRLAKTELAKLNKERDKKFVLPIKRRPHQRSKKPLKCITIEEIGDHPATEPLDSAPTIQETTGETTPVEQTEQQVTKSPNTTSNIISISETINRVDVSSVEPTAITESDNSPSIVNEPSDQTKPLISIVTHESETLQDVERSTSRKTEAGKKSESAHSVKTKELHLPSSTKMAVTSTETDQPGPSVSDVKDDVVEVPVLPVQLKLPPVPDNSILLQADWKRLRRDRKLLGEYFKNLPIAKYSSLLRQSLETDVFSDIVSILLDDYVRCGVVCLAELQALTQVNRFTVAVMFLSRKDRENLKQLFSDLKQLVSDEKDIEQIRRLQKTFGA